MQMGFDAFDAVSGEKYCKLGLSFAALGSANLFLAGSWRGKLNISTTTKIHILHPLSN